MSETEKSQVIPDAAAEAASIDQVTLDAQRAKGWTDFHPEDYCHRCYKQMTSWYVDTSTWADVMRGGDPAGWGKWQEIICIPCFTELASVHYGTEQAWTIGRDGPSVQLTHAPEVHDRRMTRSIK